MYGPENYNELFTLRHASLRNVIERLFGVFKRRFKIIRSSGPEFSFLAQIKLVMALAALYNFIWINSNADDRELGLDEEEISRDLRVSVEEKITVKITER